MNPYEIKEMIIDDGFDGEEFVTADFAYDAKRYSITFKKADLELVNSWIFEKETSLPANLSDEMIEVLRREVEQRI
ncbi:hypothetical protein SAMN05192533_11838 [Mesobacillus persicus]|uniref:Uncharacterized protein n=1 Tax=Mesobacillus persicus TaxID=930146 RepID=A0A1H8ISN1_9BACI|nr:hypothetical protein [Mesobacillus persicus]SEN71391.1 hypothetical protein SAMN05192533_11838 [Mesobacillus persicus]